MRHLLLAALLAAPASAQKEPKRASDKDRATPAPIGATASSSIAPAAKAVLANGLGLSLIESHRLPLVAVTLVIPAAGSDADPKGKEGLTSFVAAMAKEGVPGLPTAADLADAIDDIGSSLSVSAGSESTTVTIVTLKENLGRALELASKVVREPSHLTPSAESAAALERLRQRSLSGLEMEKGNPESIASERLSSALFGDTPRGRPATPEAINAITAEDVAARHRASMVPNGAVLSVAGDVTMDELKALAGAHFGTWSPSSVPAPAAPTPVLGPAQTVAAAPTGLVIELVDLPGTQAQMMLGVLTAPRLAADYDALSVAVNVLGGPLVGRLEQNIRERNRWAYGARAGMSAWKDGGMTEIETKVQADKCGDAMGEILKEIALIRSTPVPAEELAAVKVSLKGLYLQRNRTVQSLAARQAAIETMGLPASTLNDYPQRIDALTAAQIQAAAAKWLNPSQLKVVIVGDAALLKPQLAPYGTVKVFDADGKPKA
ncbi:MAG: insulinase family protein [Elusimicrobiota bacterium]|nr:MAG: insulinase family protein [Elusimicrobiota bacterium]